MRHGAICAAAGLIWALPVTVLAAAPPECSQRDLTQATVPGGTSFEGVRRASDIGAAFAKMEPSQEDATVDGVITDSDIYYPFDAMTRFGFTLKMVVGVNGRVRCIALAPSLDQTEAPQWNPQRRAWAQSIAKWRFRPLMIHGKPEEALTQLEIRESELPRVEVPMPKGDPSQVVIVQDMPYFGYRVELHGDGTAIYSGDGPYYFLGPQPYRVDPLGVALILKEAEEVDFWSLRDVYPAYSDHADTYMSRITITLGGQTKSLTEYDAGLNSGLLSDAHFLAFRVRHEVDVDSWRTAGPEMIDRLKSNGFDFKSKAAGLFLLQIMGQNYVLDDTVLSVMALGAPQDAFAVTAEGEPSRTLLEAALFVGRTAIAKQIMAGGALQTNGQTDPAKVDRALQAAMGSGKLDTVDLILPLHPSMTFTDPGDAPGITPVQASVLFKLSRPSIDDPAPIALVQRLLDMGADIHGRAANGETLLHRWRDNPEMVQFLLDHGADINALDHDGRSPLVSGDSEDMTLFLLEHGADPRVGKTPQILREIIAIGKWPRVTLWLRAHGDADVLVG